MLTTPQLSLLAADSSPLETIVQSVLLILFSEIGNKAFLTSILLTMHHPCLLVFSSAITSLLLMSALSTILGYILPFLILHTWCQFAVAVLFLIFRLKIMAVKARKMMGDAGSEKMCKELGRTIVKRFLWKFLVRGGERKCPHPHSSHKIVQLAKRCQELLKANFQTPVHASFHSNPCQ